MFDLFNFISEICDMFNQCNRSKSNLQLSSITMSLRPIALKSQVDRSSYFSSFLYLIPFNIFVTITN